MQTILSTITELEREKASVAAGERRKAAASGDALPDGSYPITSQSQADKAWVLRRHGNASEATVKAHISAMVKKHGLKHPDPEHDGGRQKSAYTPPANAHLRPHGFAYPDGLKPCAMCGEPANSTFHVNPASQATLAMQGQAWAGQMRTFREASAAGPIRNHVYTSDSAMAESMRCQTCGQSIGASVHTAGLPVSSQGSMWQGGSSEGVRQAAHDVPERPALTLVAGGKVILATQATVLDDESVPRELAAEWEKAQAANGSYLWLAGKYVEADKANRNKAFWTSGDLEFGAPSVAHGPLNWLHQERHIIGTIADAALVPPRQAASDGTTGRAHISAMAAAWPFLFPAEARAIVAASDQGRLWYSMESVSREVACLAEGCTHAQSYQDYMRNPLSRCQHVKDGGDRRFVDPVFLGGAVILGGVRPGWADAELRVASKTAERQAAAFEGTDLSTTEAEMLVAGILAMNAEES